MKADQPVFRRRVMAIFREIIAGRGTELVMMTAAAVTGHDMRA